MIKAFLFGALLAIAGVVYAQNDAGDFPCDWTHAAIEQPSILCYELKSTSPYKGAGSDGLDLGVTDLRALARIEACAWSGNCGENAVTPTTPSNVRVINR